MLEQQIVYLKKSIPRLKKNFQTLKDFFHECSSSSNKINEIVCSANEEFNNSNITDFFLSEKTIPVIIKGSNSPFSIQENGLITLTNKFFLLYAIGFNNILSCREDLCAKLERVKVISQIDPTNRADVPGQLTDDLQAVFDWLKKAHLEFKPHYNFKTNQKEKLNTPQTYSIQECGGIYSLFYSRAQHFDEKKFFNFLKTTSQLFKTYTDGLRSSQLLSAEFDEEDVVRHNQSDPRAKNIENTNTTTEEKKDQSDSKLRMGPMIFSSLTPQMVALKLSKFLISEYLYY